MSLYRKQNLFFFNECSILFFSQHHADSSNSDKYPYDDHKNLQTKDICISYQEQLFKGSDKSNLGTKRLLRQKRNLEIRLRVPIVGQRKTMFLVPLRASNNLQFAELYKTTYEQKRNLLHFGTGFSINSLLSISF